MTLQKQVKLQVFPQQKRTTKRSSLPSVLIYVHASLCTWLARGQRRGVGWKCKHLKRTKIVS